MSHSPSFRLVTSGSVLTATCVLGLLYFGRDVLEPLALSLVLSLVIAPLVRAIARTGIGQLPATLISVLLSAICILGACIMLASQIVAVTADLPQYRKSVV